MPKMEREEKIWLGIIALFAIIFNLVTLSPLIPWIEWDLYGKVQPSMTVRVVMYDHKFFLIKDGKEVPLEKGSIVIKKDTPVEFIATSKDLTYGFGVFSDETGQMQFQMQVIPKYENRMVWVFKDEGSYTVRSTEYSGPEHPKMFVEGAIEVVGG